MNAQVIISNTKFIEISCEDIYCKNGSVVLANPAVVAVLNEIAIQMQVIYNTNVGGIARY